VHPLWFYKHQHDNRVRSKLFVACQRWWFQWLFWFIPSVPGYLREEEEHKPDPWRNPIERNHRGLHLENELAVVKTSKIISNNPVFVKLQLGSHPLAAVHSAHLHTNSTQKAQTIHRTTQNKQHTEQHKNVWKSAGRAPSLRVIPWYLPYKTSSA